MQLKQLVDGLGKLLNAQAGKMLVARAQSRLVQVEQEASNAFAAAYGRRFPAEHIYATMSQVVEAMLDYADQTLSEWRALPMRQSANGRSAQFHYTLDFQVHYRKGEPGSQFKPVGLLANSAAGVTGYEVHVENVSVSYRLTLDVRLEASDSGYVRVACSANETIDPGRVCAYIQSGRWSVPSQMELRCNGDPGMQLIRYLAVAVEQNRPSMEQWKHGEEWRLHPVADQYRAKLTAAKRAVDDAHAALARPRIQR
jgi:hypothetical protein